MHLPEEKRKAAAGGGVYVYLFTRVLLCVRLQNGWAMQVYSLKLQAPALDVNSLTRWRLCICLALSLVSVLHGGPVVTSRDPGARRGKMKHASITAIICRAIRYLSVTAIDAYRSVINNQTFVFNWLNSELFQVDCMTNVKTTTNICICCIF